MPDILTEGEYAPEFKLMNDKYEEVSLSDFSGKKVILYFYPKDNTPGCTQQAKDFSENIEEFKAANAVILGISKDDIESHEHFKSMYKIPFSLLSDRDAIAIMAYGVWVEKNMYGKKYMGIERSTFLIDEEGKVKKIWRKVKVKGHIDEVLKEV